MAERLETESIAGEMRALATQTERLIRSELTLALVRAQEAIASGVPRVAMIVAAGVLGIGGIAYLFHAIYSALSLRLDTWAAALITAVLSFMMASILGALALRRSTDPVPSVRKRTMVTQ